MKSDFLKLIPAVLTIIYVTYGTWFFIQEIITSLVPCTLVSTGVIVALIVFFRIPPPDKLAVETILGKDLNQEAGENGFTIKTVAHRGAGLDAPENTLEAFKRCHENGCDIIEFDVALTLDGIPVVFHDAGLERMSDSNVIVKQTTYEDLSKIDISVKHAYRDIFPNAHIPTLKQAVEQMLSMGQRMFIDLKEPSIQIVPVILTLFKNYPELQSKAVVTTFFPHLIYLIRRSSPEIVCCLAWRQNAIKTYYLKYPERIKPNKAVILIRTYLLNILEIIHNWALPRITYYLLGLSVILLNKDYVCRDTISTWNSLGIRVMAWTVNSRIEKQHLIRNLQITYLTDTLTGENTVHNAPVS